MCSLTTVAAERGSGEEEEGSLIHELQTSKVEEHGLSVRALKMDAMEMVQSCLDRNLCC